MTIGDKIKKLRTDKDLSQKEIALSVGIDRGQYSRIETNKVEPTISTLEKIALALDVNVAYFFSEDQPVDINSFDKSLVEKVRLIEQLDEKQKMSLFTFIDTAIANKRLKDTLNNALNMAG